MAKDSSSSSTIWRTVVFAGAMLGSPLVASAQDAPSKAGTGAAAAGAPAQPAKQPVGKPDPAVEKQEKIKTLDAERTALYAKLVETEPKAIDQLKKEIVAKDVAIKKLVDEIVALRKPRPRTPVVQKPVGRGFVLA